MSPTVRAHLEESERQLALAQLRREIGNYAGAEVADLAARVAASKARRESK